MSNEAIFESSENLTISFESDDKSFDSEYKRSEIFDSEVEETEQNIDAEFGEFYGNDPVITAVDDALSHTSVNPVQNRVITGEITEIKRKLTNKADLIGGKIPTEQLPDAECEALSNVEIENLLKNFK